MRRATISNALIRCTRSDRKAARSFELVRADLGLWVLDLDSNPESTISEQIKDINDQLQMRLTELKNIREGGLDYTLHLTCDLPGTTPIILPIPLTGLASECGFNIEIYVRPNEEGQQASAPNAR